MKNTYFTTANNYIFDLVYKGFAFFKKMQKITSVRNHEMHQITEKSA